MILDNKLFRKSLTFIKPRYAIIKYEAVSPIISSLEKHLGRDISVVDFGAKEFEKKCKAGDEFITNILSSKIIELI